MAHSVHRAASIVVLVAQFMQADCFGVVKQEGGLNVWGSNALEVSSNPEQHSKVWSWLSTALEYQAWSWWRKAPDAPRAVLQLLQQEPLVVTAPPEADDSVAALNRAVELMFTALMFALTWVWACIVICIAYQYKKQQEDPPAAKYTGTDDFGQVRTSIFGCFEDLPRFCFTLQCPWIQWAENMSAVSTEGGDSPKEPALNFWVGLWICLALSLGTAVAGWWFWIVSALVLTYFRQKFRSAFGMDNNAGSCLTDCCCYLCCTCFFIAQDKRHLDEARRCNHPAMLAV